MGDVVLEYRREGVVSTGRIFLVEGSLPEVSLQSFEKVSFSVMMTHLARAVQKDSSYGVLLVRSDYANLRPTRLDQETIDLLRSDPVTAIRSMTVPSRHIDIKRKPLAVESSPIRIGYDALADSFGDQIYCKLSSNMMECPVCGRWADIEVRVLVCKEPKCSFSILMKPQSSKWATIETIDLLGSPFSRFYLPRAWNPNSIWISKQELQDLFDHWTQEKVANS